MTKKTASGLRLGTAVFALLGTSAGVQAATDFPGFGSSDLLKNTATVALPSNYTDPDTDNNTDSQELDLEFDVNLVVEKTDGVTAYVPGETTTYTVTVTNTGKTSAEDITVTDSLPAGMSIKSTVTCVATTNASCGAADPAVQAGDTSFTYKGGRISAGSTVESLTFSFEVAYASSMTATVANKAVAKDESSQNQAEGTDPANSPTPKADLAITKAMTDTTVTTYVPGGTASYELVVTNVNGPSDVTGATINDLLPDGVKLNGDWTCTATGTGSSCPASGNDGATAKTVNLTVDVVVGGSVTVTVPVIFDMDAANY